MLTRLKNKLSSGLTAAKNLLRDHPAVTILLLLVLGVFVVPFLILFWNMARNRLPEGFRKVVPAAKPVDAAAKVEAAKPGTVTVADANPS